MADNLVSSYNNYLKGDQTNFCYAIVILEIMYRLYCRHKPFRNICQKSIKHSDEKHNNFVFVNALSLRYENNNITTIVAESMEKFLN